MPPVERSLAEAGWRLHRYGNFASAASIESEAEDAASASKPVWRTFDYRPRFGNNYVGLRNRIAVLSEAYSYLDFARRIAVTEAFVATVLREIDRQRDTIGRLVADVDRDTARRASDGTLPRLRSLPRSLRRRRARADSGRSRPSGEEPTVRTRDACDDRGSPRPGRHARARSVRAGAIDSRLPPRTSCRLICSRHRTASGSPTCFACTASSRGEPRPPSPSRSRPSSLPHLHREERTFQGHNTVRLSGAARLEQLTRRGRCPPGFNRPTPFTARHTAARSGVRRWGGDVEWTGCLARAGQGRTCLSGRESDLEASRGLKFGARPSIARTSRVGRGVMPCQ